MFKKLIQGKLICSYCHKRQVDKKIVPNNLVRNFEVQLKQIQNSCQSQIQNEILGARKHESMLLWLCTALIMMQYLDLQFAVQIKWQQQQQQVYLALSFLHNLHTFFISGIVVEPGLRRPALRVFSQPLVNFWLIFFKYMTSLCELLSASEHELEKALVFILGHVEKKQFLKKYQ